MAYSYAGMLVPGVAANVADRLARVVFLDAFVPNEGDRCFDLMPPEARDSIRQQADAHGHGWRFPPFPLELLGIVEAEDVSWVAPQLGAQPLKTYAEPVRGTKREWERLPRTYVVCTESAFKGVFEPFAEVARREPGWTYTELAAGHSPMVTAPDALSKVLVAELRIPGSADRRRTGTG